MTEKLYAFKFDKIAPNDSNRKSKKKQFVVKSKSNNIKYT